jgi:hypothetical protein
MIEEREIEKFRSNHLCFLVEEGGYIIFALKYRRLKEND